MVPDREQGRAQCYGFESRDDFPTPEGKKILADCSMIGQITKDDPPMVMTCTMPDGEPENRGQLVHHPQHAKAVQKTLRRGGREVRDSPAGFRRAGPKQRQPDRRGLPAQPVGGGSEADKHEPGTPMTPPPGILAAFFANLRSCLGRRRVSAHAGTWTAVQFQDAFWAPRLETNRAVTIAHNLRELERQGSLGGFALLTGRTTDKYHGYMWGDSDVYKTLEGKRRPSQIIRTRRWRSV